MPTATRRVNWSAVVDWIVLPGLSIAGVVVLAWFVITCLTGCHHHAIIEPPSDGPAGLIPPVHTQPQQGFPLLGWLGGLCALIGVGTFVASFLLPGLLLSPKLSFGCMIAAVGLWVLQAILVAYFHVIAVVSLIAACVALLVWGLPYIVAAVRHLDLHSAAQMFKSGEGRQAVALASHVLKKDTVKLARFINKHNPITHAAPAAPTAGV